MTRSLNETAFVASISLPAFRGGSCLPESCGPPIGVAEAGRLEWKGRRIRGTPRASKDRKGHGISDAKNWEFSASTPVHNPRVKRGGEQADFWQVQQASSRPPDTTTRWK